MLHCITDTPKLVFFRSWIARSMRQLCHFRKQSLSVPDSHHSEFQPTLFFVLGLIPKILFEGIIMTLYICRVIIKRVTVFKNVQNLFKKLVSSGVTNFQFLVALMKFKTQAVPTQLNVHIYIPFYLGKDCSSGLFR